ncbi:MAG TPA: lamin tail domain-containing protein [Bacteroidales bacterium]|nr:lamin tail domain-containing protein [Bacteroidales bacterium]HPT09915.1 lamin tail domain-containing protein [Bacteroidales bacterium]
MKKIYKVFLWLIWLLPLIATQVSGQGFENFNNYTETGNAYHDGQFQGQDGSTWTYVQCRGDRPINPPTPCLGKNRTPPSTLYSGTIANGCGILSFDYKQAFSGAVNLNVLINGTVVGNVTSPGGNADTNIIHNSGPIAVNVSGDFIIKFEQVNTNSGQVSIDNLTWTGYNVGPLPEPTNYPTAFTATAAPYSIQLNWIDATGEQLPSRYLVLASEFDNIQPPVDGIPVADDPNLADGQGAMNIFQGVQNYLFSNLPSNKQYFFKIYPYTNTGSDINYKTDGEAPAANATTPNIQVLNTENFNDTTFGSWNQMTVLGDTSWIIDPIHGVNTSPCAKASGYFEGASHITEMWLFSPSFDLSHYTGGVLTFKTAKNYVGPNLKALISTDWNGISDPNEFTWDTLVATYSAGGWAWTSSGNVDISAYTGSNVHIAFMFSSTDAASSTWEVDDITVMAIPSFNLPVVSTNPAFTDVTFNSATGGGNVTDDGGSPILARGLCYSTSTNPTIASPHTTEPGTLGEFTSLMTELVPNTTYYVKAYATSGLGTGYGEVASFTTLCEPIAPVTDFEADSTVVKIGGTVQFTDLTLNCPTTWDWTFAGGNPGTFSGQTPPPVQYDTPGVYQVCLTTTNDFGNSTNCKENYITVLGPTNAQIVLTEIMYNPPESGTDSLEFLELYNNDQIAWNLANFSFSKGIVYTFPDYMLEPGQYLLVAKNATAIQNTFQLGSLQWTEGSLKNDGEPIVIVDYNGYIVDSVAYSPNMPWDTLADGWGPSLELCDPNSDNNNPVNWRHAIEFQTVNAEGDSIWASPLAGCTYPLPTVQTIAVTEITPNTAICQGNVTGDGGYTIIARGICWSESPDPTLEDNHTTEQGTLGDFYSLLSNLIPQTTYHVRAYATNIGGTAYGDDLVFESATIYLPEVTTIAITDFTHNSALIQGDVTGDGGGNILARGVCWSVSANPTLENDFTVETGTLGPYYSLINGLSPQTTYHVRAYATNETGTAYGEDLSFTTECEPIPPLSNFWANVTTIMEGDSINFFDASQACPATWSWTFEGGVPGNSTEVNPTNIVYPTAGVYPVCLTTTNTYGENTLCRPAYITVLSQPQPTNAQLVLTEIMYNPPESSTDTLEFLEIYNNDIIPWDLENFYFDQGITYVFPEKILNPGEYQVIAKNAASIQNTFHVEALEWTSGKLANEGEAIVLRDNFGFVVDSVYYLPTEPWDPLADGHGPSLELCDPSSDNTDPANWRHAIEFQAINAEGDTIWASPTTGCSYPPVAGFSADSTVIHLHDYVNFTDESSTNTTTWEWTFEGGTPATYFGKTPPPIQYNTFGFYDVTLRVANIAGHHTLVKSDYIEVGTVGMNNTADPGKFTIYPNPTKGRFKLVMQGDRGHLVRLINPLGNILFEKQVTGAIHQFDQTGMAPGVYLLQVTDPATGNTQSQKLIIQ